MGSHGVPRVHERAKAHGSRVAEELQITEYRKLDSEVETRATANQHDSETLELTSKLLAWNPEYYTVWNRRRRMLLATFAAQGIEEVEKMILSDLNFLVPLLMKFAKCYWIWNHRIWLLRQSSKRLSKLSAWNIWQQELGLVSQMLSKDSRNFHGWDYRRFVVRGLENLQPQHTKQYQDQTTNSDLVKPALDAEKKVGKDDLVEAEFTYTTSMIHSNLSNFSAWHHRTLLIPRLLKRRNATPYQRHEMFIKELALIRSAIFQDPYDQSLWFYHNHLMNILIDSCTRTARERWVLFTNVERESHLRNEIIELRGLLEDDLTADCKWIYQNLLQLSEAYLGIEDSYQLVTVEEIQTWLQTLRNMDHVRARRWDDWALKLNVG